MRESKSPEKASEKNGDSHPKAGSQILGEAVNKSKGVVAQASYLLKSEMARHRGAFVLIGEQIRHAASVVVGAVAQRSWAHLSKRDKRMVYGTVWSLYVCTRAVFN